jgi:hypothetical protein
MKCKYTEDHAHFAGQSLGDVQKLSSIYDEAWFIKCVDCGIVWLRVLFESPHFSKTGHWYDLQLPTEFDRKLFTGSRENIESVFSESPLRFLGGSYFDGNVQVSQGPLKRLI